MGRVSTLTFSRQRDEIMYVQLAWLMLAGVGIIVGKREIEYA